MFKLRGLLCLGLLVSAAAAAEPAHYVVFEVGADDVAQPVYYTQVDLALPAAATKTRAALPADPEQTRITYHAWLKGIDLGEETVDVPQVLRAEFAHDTSAHKSGIDQMRAIPAQRSFVLRVPLAHADTVEFAQSGKVHRIDLDELAMRAPTLALAQAGDVPAPPTLAAAGGNPANRVDMLVLGDGYTASQQVKFAADAANLRAAFFGLTPYREYESYVNWTSGFVASRQSGADHPPYAAHCTQATCCADTQALQDPSAGRRAATAFDATYCTGQIHRLLSVNTAKVYAAAAAWPNWDKIVVVVNDTVYGGSGGAIGVTSISTNATQIVLHEYGHSFTRLADEYETAYPGFPACSDNYPGYYCEANVTDRTSQVKWASWYTAGNPIPTPPGYSGVGLFQGARYHTSDMYRPVEQCLMRTLGVSFCPICRQEYVRRLYRGGWGVPQNGIDTIEPGTESPSTATPVAYAIGTLRPFQATLLAPTEGTLSAQWYLDGWPIAGATGARYVFRQTTATPATRTLQLRVTDTTPYVNAAMAGGLMMHKRTWTVRVGSATADASVD